MKDYQIRLILFVYNQERSCHLKGEVSITLPFVPIVGMRIQYKDMYPLLLTRVTWLTEEAGFQCIVEEDGVCEFDINDPVKELANELDIVRDAIKYGWQGFEKIYRDI